MTVLLCGLLIKEFSSLSLLFIDPLPVQASFLMSKYISGHWWLKWEQTCNAGNIHTFSIRVCIRLGELESSTIDNAELRELKDRLFSRTVF